MLTHGRFIEKYHWEQRLKKTCFFQRIDDKITKTVLSWYLCCHPRHRNQYQGHCRRTGQVVAHRRSGYRSDASMTMRANTCRTNRIRESNVTTSRSVRKGGWEYKSSFELTSSKFPESQIDNCRNICSEFLNFPGPEIT